MNPANATCSTEKCRGSDPFADPRDGGIGRNISDTVRGIRADRAHVSDATIRSRYAAFAERYPRLFDYAATVPDGEFDETTLDFVLERFGALADRGTVKLEADMDVAMHLARAYVYDDSNRPSDEVVDDCRRRLREAAGSER